MVETIGACFAIGLVMSLEGSAGFSFASLQLPIIGMLRSTTVHPLLNKRQAKPVCPAFISESSNFAWGH